MCVTEQSLSWSMRLASRSQLGAVVFAKHDGAQIPALDQLPTRRIDTQTLLAWSNPIDEGLVSLTIWFSTYLLNMGYRPRNFPGKYSGLVHLDDALTFAECPFCTSLSSALALKTSVGHLRYIGLAID